MYCCFYNGIFHCRPEISIYYVSCVSNTNAKTLTLIRRISASYVKLYVVNGKRCVAKAKTTTARKTLDPFYQQSLSFKENCQGCILQVS